MDEHYALLWSKSQDAIHVEPLYESLHKGRAAFVGNRKTDYIMLYVGSRHEIDEAAPRLRAAMKNRPCIQDAQQ